ncbi:MAG: hypothetical protein Tsb0034_27180 [Ekhidna sp.]
MKKLTLIALVLTGCIGEDVVSDEVSAEVRITNPLSNLEVNDSFQFEYMFLDNVGSEAMPEQITWSTADADVAIINQEGLVTGISTGQAEITLTAILDNLLADITIMFSVSNSPTMQFDGSRSGTVNTTTSYDLMGDFTLTQQDDDLLLAFDANYIADDGLPGLYVYLTNNPNTPTDGYEIGPVSVFSGAHEYMIEDAGLFDYDYVFYYCKPFRVKVGHGEID